MRTPEADARIAEISDRLIELYVLRDEARGNANWQEVHDLQNQIEEMAAERNKLLAGAHGS